MDSLSPDCTPLKHAYDSCFNAWFEGYLQPAVQAQSRLAAQQNQTRTSVSDNNAEPALSSTSAPIGVSSGTLRSSVDRETEQNSISLIPSLAIDPPSAKGSTAGARKVSEVRHGLLVLGVKSSAASSVDSAAASTVDRPNASDSGDESSSTWGGSLLNLLLPTRRHALNLSDSTSSSSDTDTAAAAPSLREADGAFSRSHPDLWPWNRAAGSSSSTRNSSSSATEESLPTADDEEEDEDEEPVSDTELVREFGREEDSGDAGATAETAESDAAAPAAINLDPEQLQKDRAAKMKEEYDQRCGPLFKEYRSCLQRAINDSPVLSQLLDQARKENPVEKAEPLSGGGRGAPGAEP